MNGHLKMCLRFAHDMALEIRVLTVVDWLIIDIRVACWWLSEVHLSHNFNVLVSNDRPVFRQRVSLPCHWPAGMQGPDPILLISVLSLVSIDSLSPNNGTLNDNTVVRFSTVGWMATGRALSQTLDGWRNILLFVQDAPVRLLHQSAAGARGT